MMKIPHLTLMMLMAALFTSCDKGKLGMGTIPTNDAAIDLRCCTDVEIADNPLLIEVRDHVLFGLIEPMQDIFETLSAEYIESIIIQLDECLTQGGDVEACAAEIVELFDIKTYLTNVNHELFDSLRVQYSDLPDHEFSKAFVDAVIATSDSNTRDLPCYAQLERDLIKFTTDLLMPTMDPFYYMRWIRDLALAIDKFCACIYNTYNRPCF